jgi:ribonuclease P protein component
MAVKYWHHAVQKAVTSSLYQTSAASSNLLKLTAIRNTFKAYERLKREQHIDTLFLKGKAFSVFPIRLIYNIVPVTGDIPSPVLTGFSVPKKKFGSSVKRHRIRRLMSEAWRLNKQTLYEAIPAGHQLHVFLIFTDAAMPVYETVKEAIVKGVESLKSKVESHGQ